MKNDEYRETLEKAYHFLEETINPKTTGNKRSGFVLLIIRDEEEGATDMVSNLTTDTIKYGLKDILATIEKQNER